MKLSRIGRPAVISSTATVIALSIPLLAWYCRQLALGGLIIYTLTLVAIIWYTHFTYRLLVRRGEGSVGAMIRYVPDHADVRVPITNLSARYLKTRVWADVRVEGRKADLGPDYSGTTIWQLTPGFSIEGHFPLQDVLKQFGETITTIRARSTDENQTQQLRLALRVEWTDEEGKRNEYPAHVWYFDFRRNSFVYQVGGFPDFQ
jgi:hypothetical protein